MFQNKEYEQKNAIYSVEISSLQLFFTEPQQDRKSILSKTAVA